MKIFIQIVFISFIFLISSKCYSQYYGVALYALSQIQPFGDAQVASLGNSGVAHRTGAWAALSNPAGLADLKRWELSFSRIPSTRGSRSVSPGDFFNQYSAALGLLLPKGFAGGMNVIVLDLGGPEFFDLESGRYIKRSSIIRQWHMTLAKKFGWLSLGANAKYLDINFGPNSSSTWMFDFGTQVRWALASTSNRMNWFSLGISLNNLSSGFKHEPTLKLFRIGFAWGIKKLSINQTSPISEFMTTLEYQRVVNDYGEWDHLLGGMKLRLFRYLIGNIGYNLDLRNEKLTNGKNLYQGLTYGLVVRTPGHLQLKIAYAFGVKIGGLNVHTFAITLGYRYER